MSETSAALATDAAARAAGPLAVICGAGSLPFAVADAAQRQGRDVVLFPLRGWAQAEEVARFPHHWASVGQFGRFLRIARETGCRDVVLVGSLVRPAILQIRPDWTSIKLMPRIIAAYRGGDDHLLSGLARIFEEHGFRLLGAHEVAPDILAPAGVLGRHAPGDRDRADIARGLAALAATGALDIGQAVVVSHNQVVAVEAAEGTDEMLARVAALRGSGRLRTRGGVLVKAPKPQQDRRFDLPAIGPRSVESAAGAGLSGIAVLADETIVAEPEKLIAAADRTGIFVVGVRGDERAP
jgi:DUF1009 family protein